MVSKVAVIYSKKFRAQEVKVCPDMADGIKRVGDFVIPIRAEQYKEVVSDVAVFYGFDGSRDSTITKAYHDYKNAGKVAVYIDLGYFTNRLKDGRYGYHRFSINDRHPTAYFQKVKHGRDRFSVHGRVVVPAMRCGRNIVVAGMSEKCAVFEGFKFEEWERNAIRQIQSVTDRPIVYRPKPRRRREGQAPKIEGVSFSDPSHKSIHHELADAWAVVSHHSNAGIDALLAGVPSFSDEGVATALGHSDLSLIEQPLLPSEGERRQFANDVAYAQWNRAEMRDGTVWRHLKDEGLVP